MAAFDFRMIYLLFYDNKIILQFLVTFIRKEYNETMLNQIFKNVHIHYGRKRSGTILFSQFFRKGIQKVF